MADSTLSVRPESGPRQIAVPRVRPVMQMLLPMSGRSDDARRYAMKAVLDWAAEKWPMLVPRAAWEGEDFEHDQPGLEIGTVNLPEKGLWGFRVEHPDTTVAGRVWMLEAVVASADDQMDALGVRSQCTAALSGEVPASSPRFLRSWLERIPVVDAGCSVSAVPLEVTDTEGVRAIVNLLTNPGRQLPVVVESQHPDGSWLLDTGWSSALARRTAGLAHVVRLPASCAPGLSQAIGREVSVFNGAVRTYLPGFGQPGDGQIHANVLPSRISSWSAAEGEGPGAFLEFVVAQMHRYSVSTPARIEQVPSYFQLRRYRAERERATQLERIETLQRDLGERPQDDGSAALAVLRAQLDEKQLELDIRALETADAEKKAADAEALFEEQALDLTAVREERDSLRAVNATLLAGIKRLKASKGEPEHLPTSYEEIAEWVDSSLSDRVTLLPRARRSLKSAVFNDLPLVVDCLKLLAEEYWALRTCDQESYAASKLAFDTRMQALDVDEAHSISEVSLGKLEEHYTVSYTIGHKSKQTIDRHLRGGSNTKDDHFCMRIYFFWDDDQQKVVIGHLPSHLETLST